ncbi:DUF1622 domain-containing protein [Micromonospora sp. HM5-17]|jgi:uncharacterized membrane protein|uniref:DUF1622 domain-containing protein n=1 Tax=Micromonospora sp. HM5-17 TaxID=2487710 RepID=UPI000F4987AD|nr:DUF1622 domain-containing protein [Micromonospora sp. HM5-17]ROT28262.1 DUF1622 domain-containing protein [Micromonospora sp. HM5-17]
MEFESAVRTVGTVLDAVGVAIILVGALAGTGLFVRGVLRGQPFGDTYRRYRQGLGRAILLGLEFVVAGDIIRSVAISPTFQSVGVLAVIVLVRTFLSFSLEVELRGRWPWQDRAPRPARRSAGETDGDPPGGADTGAADR